MGSAATAAQSPSGTRKGGKQTPAVTPRMGGKRGAITPAIEASPSSAEVVSAKRGRGATKKKEQDNQFISVDENSSSSQGLS